MIHSTACVDSRAKIGQGVTVGAGAVIGPDCVIGDDCEIRPGAIVEGRTTLGVGVQVGYHAVIGSEPQDLAYKGEPTTVTIGARTLIREHATVHRATGESGETTVGEDCYLMTGSHVGHNCQVGNKVIMVNNALLGGHVHVGDGAVLGGGSVYHQHVRIGRLVMARGIAGVGMDIPPFCVASFINNVSGLNRVGLKRAGIGPDARKAIAAAYKVFYREGLNSSQAIEKLESEFAGTFSEVDEFIAFLKTSKRGICPSRHERDFG